MKINYLIILLSMLSFTKCRDIASDKDYPLSLVNNASYAVRYYLALGDGYATTAYPDTTLPVNNIFSDVIIAPGKKAILYNGKVKWEEIFQKFLPADTLSLFIFHSDTLKKYSWDDIKKGYKVLRRYDLSLDDLKLTNWVINYP
ncbi:MAG TPA: hypothetical protein VIH57_13400 [Bacteroidales bacterium]